MTRLTHPFRQAVTLLMLASLLSFPSGVLAGTSASGDPDPDFDRLDGTGASGKKVNVIEWEGNLEIHVYPAGSLKSLALKLDNSNKKKPVMVIGYRFSNAPEKQLIRRAILGIDLKEGFNAYKDPSAGEYDKIVISNNVMASPLALYRLEPSPGQNYPEGHPALAQGGADKMSESREPASRAHARKGPKVVAEPAPASANTAEEDQDSGTIRPFFTRDAVWKR